MPGVLAPLATERGGGSVRCPECGQTKPPDAFIASWVCGSPDVWHMEYCRDCQRHLRRLWRNRLASYMQAYEDAAALEDAAA